MLCLISRTPKYNLKDLNLYWLNKKEVFSEAAVAVGMVMEVDVVVVC